MKRLIFSSQNVLNQLSESTKVKFKINSDFSNY